MQPDELTPQDPEVTVATEQPEVIHAEAVEHPEQLPVEEHLTQEQPEAPAQPETPSEDWKDKYVRLLAEFENFRRRTLREKEQLALTAGEQIILALLPTLDDLDRALKAAEASQNLEALKEGVELLHKKLAGALERQGVEPITALGEAFNPDLHEAIANLPVDDPEKKGKVIEEMERGYRFRGKVIRYARVVTGEL